MLFMNNLLAAAPADAGMLLRHGAFDLLVDPLGEQKALRRVSWTGQDYCDGRPVWLVPAQAPARPPREARGAAARLSGPAARYSRCSAFAAIGRTRL